MATPDLYEPAPPPPRRERARLRAGGIAGIVIGALLVAALGVSATWVLTHPQRVTDQFTVWNYSADSTIEGYADRSTMTDEGRFLFFASRPEVAAAGAFDVHCSSQLEGVGILGCYQHADKRIYLFDVTDKRLDGTEEVVAAHEMLHAAWDRTSPEVQEQTAALLETAFAKQKKNKELVERIAAYEKRDPRSRIPELYAILGTEVPDLGSELEANYGRFFTDRSVVTDLHTASNKVFVQLESKAKSLGKKLDSLKKSIASGKKSFASKLSGLNAAVKAFNIRARTPGAFPSQAQFNIERGALVDRATALKKLRAKINSQADSYNKNLKSLRSLNAKAADLYSGINIDTLAIPEL